jgi:hypothetical protein
LFVNKSIDERIKRLQDSKRASIQQVMEKSDGHEQLTIQDLLSLFGNVTQDGDENGNCFVVGENGDEDLTIFEDDAYVQWEEGAKKTFFQGR